MRQSGEAIVPGAAVRVADPINHSQASWLAFATLGLAALAGPSE
jgi:hypothetical protein